ncbi:hypothetical protein QBC32DRAFT_339141 [Pseudoneurospora amorphoporcata]|uniref:Secreted protein n=1 Tax=Pseudoneurospora amorphoporcata TaxID=241081 RepID=A0AAN6SHK9_9PEZI|nr:hypothetical protein QBC32DRAFT_339141 [Pseudoneurospora amorphoporcata]
MTGLLVALLSKCSVGPGVGAWVWECPQLGSGFHLGSGRKGLCGILLSSFSSFVGHLFINWSLYNGMQAASLRPAMRTEVAMVRLTGGGGIEISGRNDGQVRC